MEEKIITENAALSAAPEEAIPGETCSEEAASTPAEPIISGEDARGDPPMVDWQAKYEKSEARLQETLAFASRYAPYLKEGEEIAASPAYSRYLELKEKGLSAEEAFAAALSGRVAEASASKAHLTSGVPGARVSLSRMSGEEMAMARQLLGDAYSDRELERLFRRVAKP